MSKEMYISSSPHETKVAVLEDDQLVEVYFERDTDVGLVGGIYKGRVSRVLPGMQSAFVDIGLERDAFLYVSDFFYEDQEEYDKVFEEAEARATKFTAQQAEAAAAPPAPAAPPGNGACATCGCGSCPAPDCRPRLRLPQRSRLLRRLHRRLRSPHPRPPRESHDRRPFDPRRGRRRRHRGRPDFGEGRHGDRRFPPPHRPEEPPAESHSFEILPGESLAKYSHTAPAPEGILVNPQMDATVRGRGQERPATEEVPLHDKMPGEGDESLMDAGPAAETVEKSIEASPSIESGPQAAAHEPAVAGEAPPEPSAEVSAVEADATMSFAPGALQGLIASVAADRARPEVTATPVPASITGERAPLKEPALVKPPAPASPAVEAASAVEIDSVAEVASSSSQAETAAPSSLAEATSPVSREATHVAEPKETLEAARVAPAEFATASTESAALEPASNAADFGEGEESGEEEISEEGEEDLEEGELLAESTEGELGDEGELPAEDAAGAEGEGQPVAQEAASGEASPAGAPAVPGDRTYTLREPHQRPRFAPRGRRRGRRGPGGDRGPRRFDNRREAQRPGGNHHPVQIAEVLKEGQEILVQIAKEPLGTKGARITSHVALPGRYLVFMPTIEHIGVSRKIASEEERLRLRNIILENRGALTGGFIVRTAGQGRSEEEFKADLKFLSTLWNEIRSKSDRLKAPALIHRDLDLVQRLLRDLLTPDFKSVRVDSEIDYERVLDFVNRCQPALVGKVKLYSRDTPLYEEFGIQQEIEKALKPKVWLKSGGYIVINQTEALVAIDVNTGKYVGKTNRLEDTIVKTNVDAVNEIVRQVRLRDLGGIIVIDFIDMDERRNRAKVVQALEEALRSDRAPTKVISFHDFGLVAVTRKRVKQSLERTLCVPCTYCTGSGWVKSVNTVCNEILAEARKMAKGIDGNVLTLRVNPEVAKALKSREGNLISELESLTKKDVIIKSDPNVHQERFEIY